MPLNELSVMLPESIARELTSCADTLTEIRIRAEKPVQLICMDSKRFIDDALSAQDLRQLALRMMNHSYYACEHELSQGFFTMTNGCRVGVGGSFTQVNGQTTLRAIGSLCIRIARTVPDCAAPLVQKITSGSGLRSALVLSRPGMGKTTLLRDAARLLSEMGYSVGIADERCEIAASRNGVPTIDVGKCSDVIDGCPKALAMEYLIRSMAPQVIVTDEIGNRRDIGAIREAARKGVVLIASAHASSFEEFESGMLACLAKDNIFSLALLLDDRPGKIAAIRQYDQGEDL